MKSSVRLFRAVVALFALVAGPGVLWAQYNITSTTPSSFLSNVTTNQTLSVSGTSLPTTFGSGNYAYCFYTGYGASATPIIPGTATSTSSTMVIPASTINSIPQSAFVAGSFLASLTIIPDAGTSTTCTGGSSTASNTYNVLIAYSSGGGGGGGGSPTISGEAPSVILATNPATNLPAPPKSIHISGSGFLAPTTVSFGWGTGSGSGSILYESSTSLQVSLPTIPAGVTSITPTVCNSGTTCVTGTAISVAALSTTGGIISATPNPSTVGISTTIMATITGNSTAGAPSGVASVSVNGQAATTAKVTLDPATGAFVAGGTGTLGSTPSSPPIVGDFNGDGIPDLAYLTSASPVGLHMLLGSTPAGNFQADATNTNVTSGCYTVGQVAAADFNNDGVSDVAVSCIDSNGVQQVYVSLGNGDGSFQNPSQLTSPVGNLLYTADMNHDGKIDLIVVSLGAGSGTSGKFSVYTGNGNGSFTPSTVTQFNPPAGAVPVYFFTDIDGDGYPDIVAYNYVPGAATGSVDIYRNQNNTLYGVSGGSGVNTPTYSIQLLASSRSYGQLVMGDVNGDGLPDFVTDYTLPTSSPTYGATAYLNASTPGTILFNAGPSVTLPSGVTTIAAADFNGDGLADLAVGVTCTTNCTSTGYNLQVLAGDGTGNFTTTYTNLQTTGGTVGYFYPVSLDANSYTDLLTLPVTEVASTSVSSYITSGKANVTLPYIPTTDGANAIALSYPGDFNFTGTSVSLNLPVSGASVTVGVGGSLVTAQYGQPVTFTAAVSSTYAGSPTGLVSFYDGVTLIGQSTAVSGTATLTLSNLATGAHAITATYAGNTVFATGTSRGSVPLMVTQSQPTIRWSPAPSTLSYGTALTSGQLNAVAAGTYATSIPGSYQYSSAVGQVLTAGSHTLTVSFTPTDRVDFATATGTAVLTVTQAQPTITWAAPAPILIGTPLSATQLNATASGPLGAVPGQFTYTPALGAILPAGPGQALAVTFAPTDAVDYSTGTASTTITVIPLAITQIAPSSIPLGAAATTVTLTGTGFQANSVVQVNSAAVPTTYLSSTVMTATLASSLLQTVQPLKITVTDPSQSETSNAISEPIIAPPPSASFSGPPTAEPAQQPSLSFTLNSAYPVPLTGTVTLSFSGTGGVDDPSIQFASGGRTQTFTVPANSTTTPSIQIQSGTVAGTITLTLTLTAGGEDVTPSSITPVNITVPPSAPGITSVSLTRSGNTLSVKIIGYSNSREMTSATFNFTAANGDSVAQTQESVSVSTLFNAWYSNPTSDQYGSEFGYTQQFQLSQNASTIASVTVTLTNSSGTSVTGTGQ